MNVYSEFYFYAVIAHKQCERIIKQLYLVWLFVAFGSCKYFFLNRTTLDVVLVSFMSL